MYYGYFRLHVAASASQNTAHVHGHHLGVLLELSTSLIHSACAHTCGLDWGSKFSWSADCGRQAEHLSCIACIPQKRQVAFVNYRDYIGMDITSLVTLPVWIMEPYTILQKVAEIMEYTELLDRAAATEDPYERWGANPLHAGPCAACTGRVQ